MISATPALQAQSNRLCPLLRAPCLLHQASQLTWADSSRGTAPPRPSSKQGTACTPTCFRVHTLDMPMPGAVESFVETDRSYLSNDSGSGRDDGCTAVTAVLLGQKLIIANVGDSRAVLSRAGHGMLC